MTAGQIRIADVQRAASALFGFPVTDLMSPCRKRPLTRARQAAMALAIEMTGKSTTQVGAAFRRDHSTVSYAVRQARESAEVSGLADRLRERLGGERGGEIAHA